MTTPDTGGSAKVKTLREILEERLREIFIAQVYHYEMIKTLSHNTLMRLSEEQIQTELCLANLKG